MGAGIFSSEFLCFNAAKSWWFNWYSQEEFSPLSSAQIFNLVGVNDYVNGQASTTQGEIVVLRMKDGSDDFYAIYNKKEGINSDVRAYEDTVAIVQQIGARQTSWHVAALTMSNKMWVKFDWGESGCNLVFQLCSMTAGLPDVAQVQIYVDGLNDITCPPTAPTTTPVPKVKVSYYEVALSTLPLAGFDATYDAYMTTRVMNIDFWDGTGNGKVMTSGQKDNVAVLFEGFLFLHISSSTEFCLVSDDGSKLFINGTLVVNNDGLHGVET